MACPSAGRQKAAAAVLEGLTRVGGEDCSGPPLVQAPAGVGIVALRDHAAGQFVLADGHFGAALLRREFQQHLGQRQIAGFQLLRRQDQFGAVRGFEGSGCHGGLASVASGWPRGRARVAERLLLRLLALLGASTVIQGLPPASRLPLEAVFWIFRWPFRRPFPWSLPVPRLRGGFGRGLLHPSQSNTT